MISEKTLSEALALNNENFMERMPKVKEPHRFSKSFERRMNRYMKAERKYGGSIFMERAVRYCATAAAMVVCLVSLNLISAKVFEQSIWNMITGNKSGYTQVSFEKASETKQELTGQHYRLAEIPKNYEVTMSVPKGEHLEILVRKDGTGSISYVEGDVSEQVVADIASKKQKQEIIGGHDVMIAEDDESITACFVDDRYYHIVTIQGRDASMEMVRKIISTLEGVESYES